MILGGLKEGVTPLDMAHAYETFATGGNRVFNPLLGAPNQGPTGIAEIQCYAVKCNGKTGHRRQADVQADHSGDGRRRRCTTSSRPSSQSGTGDQRRDLRRRRRRQDRDDVELRRRLVRRLDAADHGRGLGRVSRRR